MREQESSSGTVPPDLSDIELAIQEIIEKMQDVSLHASDSDSSKQEAEKNAVEEIRRQSLETFAETRKRTVSEDDDESPKCVKRRGGSETISFLKEKTERDHDLRQQEINLKEKELKLQRETLGEQQNTLANCLTQMAKQQQATSQQQQIMLAQMQFQQQQAQVFASLIEKLAK